MPRSLTDVSFPRWYNKDANRESIIYSPKSRWNTRVCDTCMLEVSRQFLLSNFQTLLVSNVRLILVQSRVQVFFSHKNKTLTN